MHFLHINMFFFYLIYIIFLLRRTRWVSDALKDLRGRFSIFAPFCCKCLPFNFQFLSKMLLMCFFFLIKETHTYSWIFQLNSSNSLPTTYTDNYELLHCMGSVQVYSVIWFCFEAFEILPEADRETLLHSLWNTFQHSLAVSGY